ncbi:NAD(P)/FAD-dependent oxidoreductase [Alphaproteobacteria bacterium]|nr:NAD(P)/FAD-dependent oxidoreductase [Alphaproteobacteria bacterium]
MLPKRVNTVVVGGGQAGLAMSEHLAASNVLHVVLERSRIAERWRSERWDSLVTNGPAWHDRFPSKEFQTCGPDDFPTKHEVVQYFEDFAEQISAPVHCGVEVQDVSRRDGKTGFLVQTSEGEILADNIVAATGPFQRPLVPDMVPQSEGVMQIHSTGYRNPEQLPAGAVMVVGAGSSGSQIADELRRSGRTVYLSVGPHDRPPRAYRGRDYCWWLGVLGKWDAAAKEPGTEHVTISVSGANGGKTIDFRRFADQGIILTGRASGYDQGRLQFSGDVVENVTRGDNNYLSVLREADAYAERHGLDLPLEPEAHELIDEPACMREPVRELDLAKAGIGAIIWATGFSMDYSWIKADVFDEQGRPEHQRGVTAEVGLYFLGLPWQSRRGSAFIWGVWHDAKYLADQIGIQRAYRAYHEEIEQRQIG